MAIGSPVSVSPELYSSFHHYCETTPKSSLQQFSAYLFTVSVAPEFVQCLQGKMRRVIATPVSSPVRLPETSGFSYCAQTEPDSQGFALWPK